MVDDYNTWFHKMKGDINYEEKNYCSSRKFGVWKNFGS